MIRKIAFCVMVFIGCTTAKAAITLPDLIDNNMVLQQQTNANLWGKATAGHAVEVTTSWDNKTYTTTANSRGEWLLKVQTPAAGGPYEITFSDGTPKTITNVMIGEVWYCSGQSNMQMPIAGFENGQIVNGSAEAKATADPNIPVRMISIKRVADNARIHDIYDATGEWATNNAAAVDSTSAVAYFFARYLQQQLQVPVGVVVAAWNGSSIQQWMSKEASQEVKDQVPSYSPNCVIYQGMVAPLLKVNFKGMLWYQGEANAKESDLELYRLMMPAMVKDYRQKFENGDFPFYYVQIAPFGYSGWGLKFRLMQEELMQVVPNSGMASTLDIGDPTKIHPAEKETVAKRLAYWALNKTYGHADVVCQGPKFQHMEVSGNGQAHVYFDTTDGVASKGYYATGFEMCGSDGVFYKAAGWADTDNNRVQVDCNKLCGEQPVAVRYCWDDTMLGTCTNKSGIPASPFTSEQP